MKNFVCILGMGIALILSGCTHYYYLAETQNVPLFTQKGDLKVSGGVGCGEGTYNAEMQGAYSILDYLSASVGVMGMGSEKALFEESGGTTFHGARGFYSPVGKSMVFETYGGLGGYYQHNHYQNGTYISDITAMRMFLQPNLGYVSKSFEMAISTRISKLNYSKVSQNLPTAMVEYARLTQIARDKQYLLVEPALTLR
ncbi:MAG: hypothetical protein Q8909_11250, partial [Bacteroidota bacterium]|nr:hypothetical protein [Bacteroidota bacterium]